MRLFLCDAVCGLFRYACVRWLGSDGCAGLGLRDQSGQSVVCDGLHIDMARGRVEAVTVERWYATMRDDGGE